METNTMFEEVGCEEYFYEDADRRAWLDALELDYVNEELATIAEEEREKEIFDRWVDCIGSMFLSSEFELVEDLG